MQFLYYCWFYFCNVQKFEDVKQSGRNLKDRVNDSAKNAGDKIHEV